MLFESENCGPTFRSNSGELFAVENVDGFHFGDYVLVEGAYNPLSLLCQPVPAPAFEDNTIQPCLPCALPEEVTGVRVLAEDADGTTFE